MAQLVWKRRLGRYKNRWKGVTEIVEKQTGLNWHRLGHCGLAFLWTRLPWTYLQFGVVIERLFQIAVCPLWLNRGPNAYNLWTTVTGIFPSRHTLSQIVNHSIMLIYLPELPTDCIYVFRSIVAADSQHCAV